MDQPIELISKCEKKDMIFFYKTVFRKQTLIYVSIFALACLIFLVNAIANWGVTDWLWLSYGVFCVILFATRPVRSANRAWKKRVTYYNGNPPATTIRFDEQIELTDLDSSLKIPYEKVKEAQFVKEYLILTLETKAMHIFKLDHFVSGDANTLRQLLKEKCPQINPAQWQW